MSIYEVLDLMINTVIAVCTLFSVIISIIIVIKDNKK